MNPEPTPVLKPWYTSRTIYLNAIFILGLLTPVVVQFATDAMGNETALRISQALGFVTAAGSILLRFRTDQPIGTSP